MHQLILFVCMYTRTYYVCMYVRAYVYKFLCVNVGRHVAWHPGGSWRIVSGVGP